MVGNALADAVAEDAAARIQPDQNQIKSANWCDMIGFIVSKRLALIQADIWQARDLAGDIYELEGIPEPVISNQAAANCDLKQKIQSNGHSLTKTDTGHRCAFCKRNRSRKRFSYWEKATCIPRTLAQQIVDKRRRVVLQSTQHGLPPQGNCNSNEQDTRTSTSTCHNEQEAIPASNNVVESLVHSDVLEDWPVQSNSNESDDTEDDSEWLEDELELNLEENGIEEVMHGVSDADNSFANLASNATQGPPSKKQKHGHSNGGPSKQQQGGEHEQEQPAMQEQLQGGAQGQEQPAKQKQEQEQRQGASQANSSKA